MRPCTAKCSGRYRIPFSSAVGTSGNSGHRSRAKTASTFNSAPGHDLLTHRGKRPQVTVNVTPQQSGDRLSSSRVGYMVQFDSTLHLENLTHQMDKRTKAGRAVREFAWILLRIVNEILEFGKRALHRLTSRAAGLLPMHPMNVKSSLLNESNLPSLAIFPIKPGSPQKRLYPSAGCFITKSAAMAVSLLAYSLSRWVAISEGTSLHARQRAEPS